MTNRLIEPGLPEITIGQATGIDSQACEKMWIEDGSRPEYLAAFLKLYPVGYYLSWVRLELGKWYAEKMTTGNESNLKLLGPGLDGGKNDSGLRQLVTDFAIYQDVAKMKEKYKVLPHNYDDSVFRKLQGNTKLPWKKFFAEKKSKGKLKKVLIRASTISERYYRFKRFWENTGNKQEYSFKKAEFIDGGNHICGPTEIDIKEISGFGFWQINHETGDIKAYVMHYL